MTSPARSEIIRSIVEFLVTETPFKDPGVFQENTQLFELGVLDSLMIVSLLMHCETQFGCQIDPQAVTEEYLASPGRIADLVEKVRAEAA